jgi:hypothetical protein
MVRLEPPEPSLLSLNLLDSQGNGGTKDTETDAHALSSLSSDGP